METENAIYFYGVNGEFGFMSNFYKCEFMENDIRFKSSEQYFMYHKCLTFDPDNQRLLDNILNSNSQTEIKKCGRQVKNYNNEVWNNIRYNIMRQGLLLKFTQNDNLKIKLLNTGNKMLYEASQYDKIWGIGFYWQQAMNTNPNLYGRNLLGQCLCEVRNILRENIIV